MTKEEIVKSLRVCGEMDCSPCKYRRRKEPFCVDALIRDATNLIEAQAADAFAIALHDSSLMGKNAFGAARIKAVTDRAHQIIDEFFDAWRTGPEQDYMQEKFDRALRDIFKEDTVPFAERYPYIKEQKYRR